MLPAVRNVYILINFGDFVEGSTSATAPPYIQLLPTTDPATAHQDFVKVMLNGVDTTASQPALLANVTQSHGSPSSLSVHNGSDDGKPWYKRTAFIIAIAAAGVGALLILFGVICMCRRKSRKSTVRGEAVFVPVMSGDSSYKPLLAGAAAPGMGGQRPMSHVAEPHTMGAGYSGGNYSEPQYSHA